MNNRKISRRDVLKAGDLRAGAVFSTGLAASGPPPGPGYGGAVMTATCRFQRDLGSSVLEGLARRNIVQVRSSADPPRRPDLGEHAVIADGNDYNVLELKPRPAGPVRAPEGSPLLSGPVGIFKGSPNPNAAKLLQSFCLSRKARQPIIDAGWRRSVHPDTKEKPGRTPLNKIKAMRHDLVAVERESEAIKACCTKNLHV